MVHHHHREKRLWILYYRLDPCKYNHTRKFLFHDGWKRETNYLIHQPFLHHCVPHRGYHEDNRNEGWLFQGLVELVRLYSFSNDAHHVHSFNSWLWQRLLAASLCNQNSSSLQNHQSCRSSTEDSCDLSDAGWHDASLELFWSSPHHPALHVYYSVRIALCPRGHQPDSWTGSRNG